MEGARDQHVSKRAKLDVDRDPEGDTLNPALLEDVINPLETSAARLTAHVEDPVVWHERLVMVGRFGVNWEKELDLISQLAEDNAKNYLMWHYRRCIAEKIGVVAADKEREFAAKILSKDPTNYLGWSHREWVLGALGGRLTDELDYCQEIIEKNPFNAFAWNQRWTLITKHCLESALSFIKDFETRIALFAIECNPENDSAWVYLRRLFKGTMTLLFQLDDQLERVLVDIVTNAKARSKGADLDFIHLNKRGCLHVLKLILELKGHGYKPTRGMKDLINVLYPKSGLSGKGYAYKIRAIIESLELPE